MSLIVMKFGGTSVADVNLIKSAAKKIKTEVDAGHNAIAIVSAMAGRTNSLIESVTSFSPFFDAREYDAVVASGEIETAGLLALALQQLGVPARSWQGWQVPVKTDSAHSVARVQSIDTTALTAKFAEGMKAAVIAGFQGITEEERVSTLGRGGSDTSAVAFAAAFRAKRCDIYTDVEGVYTADPRLVAKARKIERISYEEMLELASLGAKVLQTRSVELAMRFKVPLYVRSSFTAASGTIVCDEDEIMEAKTVSGIAHSRDEAKVTIRSVKDRPGVAASVFGNLAEASVNVDMIIQNISEGGQTDITFSCPVDELQRAEAKLMELRETGGIEFRSLAYDSDVCKLSVVGIGMRSQSGVAAKMFEALAAYNINIQAIATSEIKISVLIARRFMELGVQALHEAYELQDD